MAIPLILQGIPRLLPLLAGSMYSASETDPQAIEFLMKKITGDKDKKKEITEAPTPDPEQDPQIPPSGIEEALKLIEKTNDELQNIKVSEQISDLEDDQYGNIGTRGFTEEVAQQIYQAEGYDNYQKEIQNIVRKNLGNEFTVYRGTTTEEFDLEAGEPIARAGVSVSFNPKEAENFVSGRLSLPEKKGEPVLLKIKATPEMIIMKGSDSGELVLDGYSLNQSNMEIIPVNKKD